MSHAVKAGWVTLTWDTEHFDIFLRAGEGSLTSAAWKTETTDESALWWCLIAYHYRQGLRLQLVCLNKQLTPDVCDMSFISSCGEVILKQPTYIGEDFVEFYAEKETLFSNQMHSNIPQFTLNCKLWKNNIKGGGFYIHSVLHRIEFRWNIGYSPDSRHHTIVGKDNVLIKMTLDRKHKNEKSSVCVDALPVTDGCFSIVHCKITNYNEVRVQEKVMTRYSKYNSFTSWGTDIVIPDSTTFDLSLQLDSIVAHHSDSQYNITRPTSSQRVREGSVIGSLSDDLLQLYREGTLSDATLNTQERSHSVHRSILAARSPVFRAMFDKDRMSEGRSGVVNIEDVDSDTMDSMLVFMYGDLLKVLKWLEAFALYCAADKYGVLPLKQKCADILKAGLSETNACDVLVLADKHSDEQLMRCAVGFIYDHQEVVSSAKWEELEDSNPRLTSKIVKELFLKKGKK